MSRKLPTKLPLPVLPSEIPVLISESREEFDCLHDELEREIEPNGVIERLFVDDIAHIVWEIIRLRRCKAILISVAFLDALKALLARFAPEPGEVEHEWRLERELLARGWFNNEGDRKQVVKILKEYDL